MLTIAGGVVLGLVGFWSLIFILGLLSEMLPSRSRSVRSGPVVHPPPRFWLGALLCLGPFAVILLVTALF